MGFEGRIELDINKDRKEGTKKEKSNKLGERDRQTIHEEFEVRR